MKEKLTEEQVRNEMRRIEALLSKTVANGCTEEEAASAMAMAQQRLENLALSQAEIDELAGTDGFAKKQRMHMRALIIKHPDAPWRRSVADAVASNVGVFSILKTGIERVTATGKGQLVFFGQEHMVEGGALVAEYLVNTIDALSAQYASTSGSGQSGRRHFAKGAALRMYHRIKNSFNLSGDPALPLIVSKSKELAETAYKEQGGTVRSGRGFSIPRNQHAAEGYRAAESVDLRGANRARRIG